jgi:hypothetical protein
VAVEDVQPVLSAEPPAKKVGFIKKEGHVVKNWKSRYFVLLSTPSESKLTYYEKAKPTAPFGIGEKGNIALKGCTVQATGKFITLLPKSGAQSDSLKLDFEANDKDQWVDAIRAHIAYANSR